MMIIWTPTFPSERVAPQKGPQEVRAGRRERSPEKRKNDHLEDFFVFCCLARRTSPAKRPRRPQPARRAGALTAKPGR